MRSSYFGLGKDQRCTCDAIIGDTLQVRRTVAINGSRPQGYLHRKALSRVHCIAWFRPKPSHGVGLLPRDALMLPALLGRLPTQFARRRWPHAKRHHGDESNWSEGQRRSASGGLTLHQAPTARPHLDEPTTQGPTPPPSLPIQRSERRWPACGSLRDSTFAASDREGAERWRSAARDLGLSISSDLIASPLHRFVRQSDPYIGDE
jgi:hypothetical protein